MGVSEATAVGTTDASVPVAPRTASRAVIVLPPEVMEVTGGSFASSGRAAAGPSVLGSARLPEIAELLPPSRRHSEFE